ncbi:MAG: hypothetical protein PHH00_00885 [Candidatus Nanoarchaeia archaeon]|nr:hypothetical protein [Candidatus Nanoarchaeia archaeon]
MKDEKQKISALMILEVIGKPKEFLTETLENLAKQMDTESGIVVKSKNIKEPKKMDEQTSVADDSGGKFKVEPTDFYVSFAEIEVEAESIFNLVFLMFKYMPANVEIFSPEVLALTNNGWNEILNELIRRLHSYDEVARVLQVEKAVLENKLKSILNPNQEKREETNPREDKAEKKGKKK